VSHPGPLQHRAATFLRERERRSTGEDLLRLAAALAEAIPDGKVKVVGVSSGSAGYVAAAAQACWSRGLELVVLDPSLRAEAAVLARGAGMVVLADAARPTLPDALVVPVAQAAGVAPLSPVWPDEQAVAVNFFTSGSAGEPKLVRKRGYQLFRQVEQELSVLGVSSGVSVYSLAPPYHILGFVYGLFLPLLGGGRAAFAPGELPAVWIRELHQERPDLVVGVPMHYRLLARFADEALPRATYFSSGAPLPEAVCERFRQRSGQRIVQGYGSTETGGIARRQGFGAWTPFPGLSWRIQDADGRLAVRSPWQQQPDRWHVTDDIAEADGEGFRLLGRADSVIKVAGKRFSLDEVDRAARGLEGVEQAAAVTYERYGELAVGLFVVPGRGAQLSPETVRARLGQQLAPFKLPRTVRLLADLPRLPSGKVDRQQLRALCS